MITTLDQYHLLTAMLLMNNHSITLAPLTQQKLIQHITEVLLHHRNHWIQDIVILRHPYQQRHQLHHHGHLDILMSLNNHNHVMKQHLQKPYCLSVKIGMSIIITHNNAIKEVLSIASSFMIAYNNTLKDTCSVTCL